MKNITFLVMLFICAISVAQIENTSFEEPEAIGGDYTDTGDPAEAHDLINNTGEPYVNFTSTGGELGFTSSYIPYDTPGVGLTDGDSIGVTSSPPSGDNPFPDGEQGYQVSDVDGNFILEFDSFVSTSTGPSMSIQFFISETGYEGNGTVNEAGSDRLRIYVRHLEEGTEHDIINTTDNDINDLEIEGQWIKGFVGLPPFNDLPLTFQLVIEVRCNSATEAFYFDNVHFEGSLGLEENNKNLFSIYPNPSIGDYVTISSKISGNKNVVIYNVLGNQVLKTTIFNDRLDISELSSGIYIVKISQENSTSTKKLIVK
ncbi:MAG: hypothetical protein ACI9SJ_001412 [Flavobacteriaceae bacterium]|jgi:hypothetical protein|uniref:T9SS type A sorting domain-containing protein n=1 Tax=Candidatus Marifrigoribacter sp. Uisw_064 TaxID=3230970 RepID=UPI003ADC213B